MLEIINKEHAFDSIENMIRKIYRDRSEMDNHVILFGYNNITIPIIKQMVEKGHVHDRTMVVFQMEQLSDNSQWWDDAAAEKLSLFDEVWDYDHDNISFLENKGIDVEWKPMVYVDTPQLPDVDRDIDILFYGASSEKREQIGMELFYEDAQTKFVNGIWGDKLLGYLARSKIVLNLHFYDNPIRQEQARISHILCNGRCVISDTSPHNYFGDLIVETDSIIDTCMKYLEDGKWKDVEANARDGFREMSAPLLDHWLGV